MLAGQRTCPAGEATQCTEALAEQLGISRLTLRSALSRLEAEGLVRARQGSGVTVLDWRGCAGLEVLPHLVAEGRADLLEPFLVLRRAVASAAVALGCQHASDADLDELQGLADTLATASGQALRDGNLEFARAVIALADNLPMTLLFNTVMKVFESRAEVAEALVADEAAVRASFGLIVSLFRTRDPDMAREAVRPGAASGTPLRKSPRVYPLGSLRQGAARRLPCPPWRGISSEGT